MLRYPKTERHHLLDTRESAPPEDCGLAKEFDYEYFDGPRHLGLGGYRYIKGFWSDVVQDIATFYSLGDKSSVLDVGCGKGFTLFEFSMLYPTIRLRGLEKSQYCINNSLPIVRPHIDLGCCTSLPYDSNSFDLAISIATIHNLDLVGVKRSLRELMRVSKRTFIKVNGYRTEEERIALKRWNLVAETILSVSEWEALFDEVCYEGEWEFFVP
jgi:SAM-dependent methyltransferase